jgi:hypothetical protein
VNGEAEKCFYGESPKKAEAGTSTTTSNPARKTIPARERDVVAEV